MIAHDSERQAALHGYSGNRRYILENRNHHKRAEMLVRMICREDGSKQFEVVIEAARPDLRERSRITPNNYTFETAGTEDIRAAWRT